MVVRICELKIILVEVWGPFLPYLGGRLVPRFLQFSVWGWTMMLMRVLGLFDWVLCMYFMYNKLIQ